jgi:hypothetical protein
MLLEEHAACVAVRYDEQHAALCAPDIAIVRPTHATGAGRAPTHWMRTPALRPGWLPAHAQSFYAWSQA